MALTMRRIHLTHFSHTASFAYSRESFRVFPMSICSPSREAFLFLYIKISRKSRDKQVPGKTVVLKLNMPAGTPIRILSAGSGRAALSAGSVAHP